jgi:hypothetical protein
LKPKVLPYLDTIVDLSWEELFPAFCELDILDIQRGMVEPKHIWKMLKAGDGHASRLFVIANLKHKSRQLLRKEGLEWDEVKSTVKQSYNIEQLRKACRKPKKFIKDLVHSESGVFCRWPELAHTAAIRQLRPKIETELRNAGFHWAEVLPVLQTMEQHKIVRYFIYSRAICQTISPTTVYILVVHIFIRDLAFQVLPPS